MVKLCGAFRTLITFTEDISSFRCHHQQNTLVTLRFYFYSLIKTRVKSFFFSLLCIQLQLVIFCLFIALWTPFFKNLLVYTTTDWRISWLVRNTPFVWVSPHITSYQTNSKLPLTQTNTLTRVPSIGKPLSKHTQKGSVDPSDDSRTALGYSFGKIFRFPNTFTFQSHFHLTLQRLWTTLSIIVTPFDQFKTHTHTTIWPLSKQTIKAAIESWYLVTKAHDWYQRPNKPLFNPRNEISQQNWKQPT